MPSRMPCIPLELRKRFGDEPLVQAIPEAYWPHFLALFQEAIYSFYPPAERASMYWAIGEGQADLVLKYLDFFKKEAQQYFDKVVANKFEFFVTKRDWDDRFMKILRDSA